MLNIVMAYVIYFLGLGVMIAGGMMFVTLALTIAINYHWDRLKGLHNIAVLTRELKRLRDEGKLWGHKPEAK